MFVQSSVKTLLVKCPSVQWKPDGLTIRTEKWFLGAGFLGAPPISLSWSAKPRGAANEGQWVLRTPLHVNFRALAFLCSAWLLNLGLVLRPLCPYAIASESAAPGPEKKYRDRLGCGADTNGSYAHIPIPGVSLPGASAGSFSDGLTPYTWAK